MNGRDDRPGEGPGASDRGGIGPGVERQQGVGPAGAEPPQARPDEAGRRAASGAPVGHPATSPDEPVLEERGITRDYHVRGWLFRGA